MLVPCRNEEQSVGQVVADFRAALPTATIYVYDNCSTDRTADRAREAGAILRVESRPGKGNVVQRMFADVEADIYILVDGDATYDAAAAPAMVKQLVEDDLDMVVGTRDADSDDVYRPGHDVGNRMFNRYLRVLFGGEFTDVFSGYRVMTRRFVKSFPCDSAGFEVETEITAHTVEMNAPCAEFSTHYRARHEDSASKLHTLRDGARIGLRALLAVQGDAAAPLLRFALPLPHSDGMGDRDAGHHRVRRDGPRAAVPDRDPRRGDPDRGPRVPHLRDRVGLGPAVPTRHQAPRVPVNPTPAAVTRGGPAVRRTLVLLGLSVVVATLVASGAPAIAEPSSAPAGTAPASTAPAGVVPAVEPVADSYIVTLVDTAPSAVDAKPAEVQARGGFVAHVYDTTAHGFAARLTPDQAADLAA